MDAPDAALAALATLAALTDRLEAARPTPILEAVAELERGKDAVFVCMSAATGSNGNPAPPLDESLALLTRVLRRESAPRALRLFSTVRLDVATTLAPVLDASAGAVEVLNLRCVFCVQPFSNRDALNASDAKILAPHLALCTHLRHLDLSENPLGMEGLHEIMSSLDGGCKILEYLNLAETELDVAASPTGLQHQPVMKHGNLRRLKLTRSGLNLRSAGMLVTRLACPNLEELDLSCNDLRAESSTAAARLQNRANEVFGRGTGQLWASVAVSCPNLRTLFLQNACLGSQDAAALAAGLGKCSNLERLILAWNPIETLGMQVLAPELAKCTNLRELDFSHSGVCGSGGAAHIGSFFDQHEGALERLVLLDTKLGPWGVGALAPSLGRCTSLRHLVLSFNPIGDEGVAALAPALERLVSLQSLDLTACEFGPGGIKALAPGLSKCTKLSELVLASNALGPMGAAALAPALATAASLRTLNLSKCYLRDLGTRRLASLLVALPGLEELDLNGNDIANEGARSLAEQLRTRAAPIKLDLCRNYLGEQGIFVLAYVLPWLHPESDVSFAPPRELESWLTLCISEALLRRAVLTFVGGAFVRRGDGAAIGDGVDGGAAAEHVHVASAAACRFVRSDGDTAVMRRVLGMLVGKPPPWIWAEMSGGS